MPHHLRRVSLVRWLALCLAGLLLLAARPGPIAGQALPQRPALIVLIVVDQMRADYIDRFRTSWTGGLHRVLADGAVFPDAAYPHLATWTCAGHATVSTGATPAVHGIMQNAWWDRGLGRIVSCTQDPEARTVSYGAPAQGGSSPWRLRAPTLADELRAQRPGSRTVALSLKDRSAIMLAGRQTDLALWFDARAGTWVTSSAYAREPLPPIRALVERNPVAASLGQAWTPRLDPGLYRAPDDGLGENPPAGWTARFPHPLDDGRHQIDAAFYDRWQTSPLADAALERLAEAAIDGLALGQRSTPDLLAIGFSALDNVGHDFGPDSQEAQDVLAHLDDTLGRLLETLDGRVGRGRYVVALTADHGVPSIPEQARSQGRDAGRISAADIVERVERALDGVLGPGPHVARMVSTDLYFLPEQAAAILGNPAAVAAGRAAVLAAGGIAAVATPAELARPGADPLLQAASLSYVPDRSGDLLIVPRPGWIIGATGAPRPATNHGSASPEDRRVPLILMGPAVAPGTYPGAVSPADIAPTLAALAGITMFRAEGRVLGEAIGR